ncbi:MAG: PilZ domain-containing protein [Planctomycetes bacterium]|nr:PilZ domain-containing protein [Planctomycetota bacterium]
MAGHERQDDRREHPRHPVSGGNAEIVQVFGPQGARRRPSDRARIVNWSRGGLLLKVPSPRRRLVFFKQPPVLAAEDQLKCTLRLPPQYNDIELSAEVVRVERCVDDPDHVHVALSFLSLPADRVEQMAALLEPKPKVSARVSRGASGRVSARSGRASQRVKQSQRVEAASSQRLGMRQTETLELRNSARLSRTSGRH